MHSKKRLQRRSAKEKSEVKLKQVDPELEQEVRTLAEAELKEAVQVQEKHARQEAIDAVMKKTRMKHLKNVKRSMLGDVKEVLHKIVKEEVRRLITD